MGHALQKKSDDRKIWLFYWNLFACASWVLYYLEWLIMLPFTVLSFYIDIYYEVQLLAVLWLVFPKTMGVVTVKELIETNANAVFDLVQKQTKEIAKVAYHKIMELQSDKKKQ